MGGGESGRGWGKRGDGQNQVQTINPTKRRCPEKVQGSGNGVGAGVGVEQFWRLIGKKPLEWERLDVEVRGQTK